MGSLIAAALVFLGIHVLVSGTPVRAAIVRGIGKIAYLALFSIASLGAIVWMAIAYGEAPDVALWSAGPGARHGALLIMLPAALLVVLGATTPNPTAAGGDKHLEREAPRLGVMSITRHPFLWGIALWALAHVIANGDLASLIFFAAFGLLALIGPHLIDAKLARRKGAAWERYAAMTSWLPFQAMLQKRARFRLAELGWWRLALGLAVYLALIFLFHPFVIGVPLLAIGV